MLGWYAEVSSGMQRHPIFADRSRLRPREFRLSHTASRAAPASFKSATRAPNRLRNPRRWHSTLLEKKEHLHLSAIQSANPIVHQIVLLFFFFSRFPKCTRDHLYFYSDSEFERTFKIWTLRGSKLWNTSLHVLVKILVIPTDKQVYFPQSFDLLKSSFPSRRSWAIFGG